MQRLCAFLLLSLSVALSGCATVPREVASPAKPPAPPVAQPAPRVAPPPVATTHPYVSAPPVEAGAAATPQRVSGTIALLLPLKSPVFGHAAKAVKDGFMAAYGLYPAEVAANAALRIKLYPTGDQPNGILAAYRQAIQEGSQVVVGPLTRNDVTTLAGSGLVSVPTLALNIPNNAILPPHDLYFFGLSVEAEARQVAQIAYNSGKRKALIIAAGSPLSKRSQQAFTEEWEELGGEVVGLYQASDDPDTLSSLGDAVAASNADMIFLALGYNHARWVRPYLPLNAAIYATSRIDDAGSNPAGYFDLDGVQFVDMPWLLQPDHPAVMIYPRPDNLHSADSQRLYALGVDAYRLSRILLGSSSRNFALDGVTGQIHLGRGNLLSHQLVHAEFHQGKAVVVNAPAP